MSSAPDDASAAPQRAFERLLRHERAITLAGLFALVALAWAWLFAGAGLDMDPMSMSRLALGPQPHVAMMAPMASMPGMPAMPATPDTPAAWSPANWALMVAMWWTMMIAMMTPSAAPTILLYARVHHHAAAQGNNLDRIAPTGAFAAGYLLLWLAFALVATAAQALLDRSGLLSAHNMGLQSRWLSGAVLLLAGAYQLSPLKNLCLAHCRAPAAFLSRHWRPGVAGALRLGALHGAFCIGCCWLLMALLFVAGVMNLAWVALLSLLVLAEKLLPGGAWVGRVAGFLLLAWGAATLAGVGA